MFIRILLGFIGLGIVVFVHELGHFLMARLAGITVEAFSIGWGKPILKKKIGGVEYRLGLFPVGGYCKMKGDSEFEEAYKNSEEGKVAEKGSFYAASPFSRILACFGGPFFNFAFAVLVLSVIWGIGFEVNTLGNRIILASEINPGTLNPADEAGLQTGDRIVSLMGKKTETYNDIQEVIALNPGEVIPVQIERNGRTLDLQVTPVMERSTGAGRIGVYFWTDPIVERIVEGSPAQSAGLRSGDRLVAINGTPLPHTMALYQILEEKPAVLNIEYLRDDITLTAALNPIYTETGDADLGLAWKTISYHTPSLSPPEALAKGAVESWKTFTVSVKSLSFLFKGIDLTQAVSGPVRITYMLGEAATEGFNQSFGTGISSMASFLSLISIALCMMNLLPLPILDGGMILLFLVEGLRRKPLHPRFVSIFQTVGVVLIAGLMIFAVFGDIMYLSRR
ncbi:MAG: site-2 protease family protein [Treponema sp.]|jgi:regulator of sigma E protease|nr:site-2 protease family protein [Treponema sp.]